jgi:hypothetical protein
MTGILATLCFNNYNPFQPSKCYVPSSLIAGIDPFLPLLERFIEIWRSPFMTLMYLNLFEVAPRKEQLAFVVGCTEKWLERFPQDHRFWIEWSIGRRLAVVLKKIFEDSPSALAEDVIRKRIDSVVSRLIGLGVPEAHELEQNLSKQSLKASDEMEIVIAEQYAFLDALVDALDAIDETRLFADERGARLSAKLSPQYNVSI